MAQQHRDANLLAFEVYQPALARVIGSLSAAELEHVRVVEADAVDGLSHLLPPESIDEPVDVLPGSVAQGSAPQAPDPVSRLRRPGGVPARSRAASWRLATDWEHYAEQMRGVLDAHPRFRNEHRGWAPRWSARPITRFEQRGLDAGRRGLRP